MGSVVVCVKPLQRHIDPVDTMMQRFGKSKPRLRIFEIGDGPLPMNGFSEGDLLETEEPGAGRDDLSAKKGRGETLP